MTMICTDGLHALNAPEDFPFNQPGYDTLSWAVRVFNGDTMAISSGLLDVYPLNLRRMLVTPVIHVPASSPYLRFYAAGFSPYGGRNCGSLSVYISTGINVPPQYQNFPTQSIGGATGDFDDGGYYTISLSGYAGQDVYIGFKWTGGNFPFSRGQVLLDRIEVGSGIINHDAQVSFAKTKAYLFPGQQSKVSVKVMNDGRLTFSSCRLHCSLDNQAVVSMTDMFSLAAGQSHYVEFPQLVSAINPGVHQLKIWCDSIDGIPGYDTRAENDTTYVSFRVQNNTVQKKVLLEEYTGAWCGDCPPGGHALDAMQATQPDIVVVSIHGNDSMEVPLMGGGLTDSYAAAAPVLVVDRQQFRTEHYFQYAHDSIYQWYPAFTDRHADASPATVSISNVAYNSTTREISCTVNVNFAYDADGPFALHCGLTENNVTGPPGDTTYNHWNNHNYNSATPNSDFYGMGFILDPSEYWHNNVFDTMMSNLWGDTGFIPRHVIAGQNFSRNYTCTLPVQHGLAQRWKPNDMQIFAFLAQADDRPMSSIVLNAGKADLLLSAPTAEALPDPEVYPVPANEEVFIRVPLQNTKVQLQLFDLAGREIIAEEMHANEYGQLPSLRTTLLKSGIYMIRLSSENWSAAAKVIVAH